MLAVFSIVIQGKLELEILRDVLENGSLSSPIEFSTLIPRSLARLLRRLLDLSLPRCLFPHLRRLLARFSLATNSGVVPAGTTP